MICRPDSPLQSHPQSSLTRRDLLSRTAAAGVSLPFLAALGPSAVSAASQATPPAGNSVDRVVVLTGAEVRFFDPAWRFSSTDANPNVNIYEPLVQMNRS